MSDQIIKRFTTVVTKLFNEESLEEILSRDGEHELLESIALSMIIIESDTMDQIMKEEEKQEFTANLEKLTSHLMHIAITSKIDVVKLFEDYENDSMDSIDEDVEEEDFSSDSDCDCDCNGCECSDSDDSDDSDYSGCGCWDDDCDCRDYDDDDSDDEYYTNSIVKEDAKLLKEFTSAVYQLFKEESLDKFFTHKDNKRLLESIVRLMTMAKTDDIYRMTRERRARFGIGLIETRSDLINIATKNGIELGALVEDDEDMTIFTKIVNMKTKE